MAETGEKNRGTKKFQKSYFDVLGLCCPSEVPLIESILKSLDGVKDFSIIVPSKTVIVFHDNLILSQLQIVKALNGARLEANVRAYGDTKYKQKWPSPYAMGSGLLLLLSFLKYVYHPLRWLAIGAVAVGLYPILLRSYASLRTFRLDINILALIAVIGTIAMNDYTEAGTIVFLFTIAEWLESRASHKATVVMSSLMSLAPQKAVIAETGEEVDVEEVKLSTVLAVKDGEVIPIDGVVVDGKCEVDEKTLTGESFPVSKQKDSTVWAGTINLNGYVTIKTTALAEDCVVAKMAKLVEEAQNSKSKTQRFIDKCSMYYTPAVVIISASVAVIPVALRVHHLTKWFHLALVILVSACPCGLILSTPVATFCALTRAATTGLLIKGGDHLETLAKIKVAAFDKTGTITRGEFVVAEFKSVCEDITLNTLVYWVASIESKSSHPMAAALVDYGRSLSIEAKPDNVVNYENFPGEGICGIIDGKHVYVGNRKIALRAGCETVPTLEGDTKGGKTIGYVYYGSILAGIFSLSDACRTGAAEAINELKSLHIRTAMLTGDNRAAAMHAQQQLGNSLEIVQAELLPEDKAKMITEFKKLGPTAMIGDGLNDAPALATADIGISMGISGSALATGTGNVILMSNDIRKIPKAIKLARRTHRKVIENVALSIGIKGGILALAFAGHPLIWAAVLADVGTCLLVIFNSMLLLNGKTEKHKHEKEHQHGGKCCEPKDAHKHVHSAHNAKTCCTSKVDKKSCESKNCGPNSCTDKKQNSSVNNVDHNHGSHEVVNHCHHGHHAHEPKTTSHETHHGSHEVVKHDHDHNHGAHEFVEHGHDHNHGSHEFVEHDHDHNHGSHEFVEHDHDHNHGTHEFVEHNHDHNHGSHEVVEHDHNHDHDHDHDHEEHCHHDDECCDDVTTDHSHQPKDLEEGSGKTEIESDHCKSNSCCGSEKVERLIEHKHKVVDEERVKTKSCGGHDREKTSEIVSCSSHNLERRGYSRGCCRSYARACCRRRNFGTGSFGGGLTEIVTE